MTPESVPKKSRRRWRWLLEITILALVFFAVHTYQVRSAAVGQAPPLAGVGLQREAVDLAQFHGRPVLVYFWASWCPVCRVQQSVINSIAEDWAVLGVAWEEQLTTQELHAYAEQAGFTFPVLQDVDGSLGQRYGVQAVPTAFVIDSAGQIRFATVGYSTTLGLWIRLWLADMLARLPTATSS